MKVRTCVPSELSFLTTYEYPNKQLPFFWKETAVRRQGKLKDMLDLAGETLFTPDSPLYRADISGEDLTSLIASLSAQLEPDGSSSSSSSSLSSPRLTVLTWTLCFPPNATME